MAKNFIYTSKDDSTYGVMSCVFGLLSLVTFVLCIYKSYQVKGIGVERLGTSALLAIIFMLVGFGLSIYSLFESNKFKLFGITGIVLNTMSFLCLSAIIYAGAMYFE